MKGGAREKSTPPGGHIIVSKKKIVTEKEKLRIEHDFVEGREHDDFLGDW